MTPTTAPPPPGPPPPARVRPLRRDDVPLGWYARFVGRHRRLIALAFAVGVVAGAALVVHRGKVYTATVEIIAARTPVGEVAATPGAIVRPSTVDTEAQLLRSGPVIDAAATALGPSVTPADVRAGLSVTVPQSTRSLVVTFESHRAALSRRAVAEVAHQYLALRSRLIVAQRDRQIAGLLTYLDALRRNQSAGRGQDAVAAGFGRQATRRVIRELQDLRAAPVDPGELTTSGPPLVVASLPNESVPVVAGALLGILAAVATGLLVDRRRRRVHTVEDALALCPAELVSRVEVGRLDHPVPDRRLRNIVLLRWPDGARVAVTGAGRGIGLAVARGLADEIGAVSEGAWLVHRGVARPASAAGPSGPAGAAGPVADPVGAPTPTAGTGWLVVADDVDDPTGEVFLARRPVDLVVVPVVLGRTSRGQLQRAYAWRYDPLAPVVLVVVRRTRASKAAALRAALAARSLRPRPPIRTTGRP